MPEANMRGSQRLNKLYFFSVICNLDVIYAKNWNRWQWFYYLGGRSYPCRGEEKNVKAEDLVIIKNRNGNRIMVVCRGDLGSNENLGTSNYSPEIAYARVGRHPSKHALTQSRTANGFAQTQI